jgi:hypothetical protein
MKLTKLMLQLPNFNNRQNGRDGLCYQAPLNPVRIFGQMVLPKDMIPHLFNVYNNDLRYYQYSHLRQLLNSFIKRTCAFFHF